MKKALIQVVCGLSMLLVFITPAVMPVRAQSLWDGQTGMEDIGTDAYHQSGEPTDVRDTAVYLIKIALQFLALIFIVLILYAGFKWMTAAGNEDNIKTAKKTMSMAVIGLIIILMAWSITFFVLEELRKATTGSAW